MLELDKSLQPTAAITTPPPPTLHITINIAATYLSLKMLEQLRELCFGYPVS